MPHSVDILGGSSGARSRNVDILAGAGGVGGSVDILRGIGGGGGGIERTTPGDGGVIRTLAREIGRDISGAARTAGAVAFSPLDLLGASVPVSFSDLSQRDLIGAAMIGSIGVGAGASLGIRSILAGQGLKALGRGASKKAAREAVKTFSRDLGVVKSAGLTASSEAVAGAAFGLVKPLDADEDRAREVIENAGMFGAFGGAFSMVGSALKATVGQEIARLKGTTQAQRLAEITQREQTATLLREHAGIKLLNPEQETRAQIRRLAGSEGLGSGGEVRLTFMDADGAVSAQETFSDFNSALREALDTGHAQRLGVVEDSFKLSRLEGLDEGVLRELDEAGGAISEAVDQLDLGRYNAVREFVKDRADQEQLMAWLGAETLTESVTEFGEFTFKNAATRQSFLRLLPKDVRRSVQTDSDILRESILHGNLSVTNLKDGADLRNLAREVAVNNQLPPTSDALEIVATPAHDVTFLSWAMTPASISKVHPESRPFFELADEAAKRQELGSAEVDQFIRRIRDEVPRGKANRAVEIIEESAEAGGIAESRQAAIEAARETGDETVLRFVEDVTAELNARRLRAIGAGRLGALPDRLQQHGSEAREAVSRALSEAGSADEAERLARRLVGSAEAREAVDVLIEQGGLAGYFPIVNTGNYALRVNGDFVGFHSSRSAALRAFRDEFADQPGARAFITPKDHAWDPSAISRIEGAQFGKLSQALRRVEELDVTAKEADELLRGAGVAPSAGPRKFSGFFQERRLGIRDYSENPLDALEAYLYNTERTFAWNTFERQADRLIDNVPDAKSGLGHLMENFKDRFLGRPTRSEQLIQNFAEMIAPGEVKPFVLRRASSAIRRYTGWSRLGGALSGLVNSTQIAINTAPLIGTRWTATGIGKLMTPGGVREVFETASRNGVDLNLHVPLTKEGQLAGTETVRGNVSSALKRAKLGEIGSSRRAMTNAFERMWLWAFNGAERMNRAGTFWGAFRKGIDERGMSEEAAARWAESIVEKTQFNYRVSNIPAVLQGPVGSVVGQFKTFFINELELLASVDAATRTKMLGAFMAAGGAGALFELPGADLADSASQFFFDRKISEALRTEAVGAEQRGEDPQGLFRMLAFGAPGLIGADLSNYVGPGGFHELTRGWMGPAASDIAALGSFLGRSVREGFEPSDDTVNEFLQQALPSQLRRGLRAKEVLESGEVRNPYSKKLIYKPQDRLRIAAAQAVGFPTTRQAAERDLDAIVTRQARSYNEKRASFGREIALARINGDDDALRDSLRAARRAGVQFSPADVRRWVENMRRPASQRRRRRTPVALRAEIDTFFDVGG